MVSRRRLAAARQAADLQRRPHCVSATADRLSQGAAQRLRVLTVTAWTAAAISAGFGILQLVAGENLRWIGIVNLLAAASFLVVPRLYRFGELVAPLTFVAVAYPSLFVLCAAVGTGSGLQFFYLAAATIVLLILGVDHLLLAGTLAGLGAGLLIALQFLIPADRGAQPHWMLTIGFVVTVISASFISLAAVWVALREMTRAEAAMEAEFRRSEGLLTNILPPSIAERLKHSPDDVIVDQYDDASVLFADIADFTKHAGEITPEELVRFLDLLYTEFDLLIEQHRLEKIKISGDSYMVVSGVPERRPDHLAALARFALDMADAAARVNAPQGWPLRVRIGLAAGPVVAGVIGSRRFFYDVWGDAVNVAARMEETDTSGRIQVPQNVYERLRDEFAFEERGEVAVKGKGMMRTWFLVGHRTGSDAPITSAAAR